MRAQQPARKAGPGERQASSRAAPLRAGLPLQQGGVLALQRTAGNAAVTRHLQRVIHQEPSYVAKAGGKTSLTNRGDIDVEEHDGEIYVRVYQTVFSPVMDGGGHKDVHQREDGSIDFRNQGESAWLNMGRPWRSMHYMRTYQDQKNRSHPNGYAPPTAQSSSLVRSFLVPLETYRRVTGNAVSEKQIKSSFAPDHLSQSTDKAKDSDQYEIRGVWQSEVVGSAKPDSLVTYAPDHLVPDLGQDPRHGSVTPLSDMLGRLGMPDFHDFPEYRQPAAPGRPDEGLVLPLKGGKMPKDVDQQAHIERLGGLLTAAFPKDGNTATRRAKDARAELKRLCGLTAVKDRDVDWDAVRDRVRRAMNYAGMPAVLAEVYNDAKSRAARPDGGGFPVRNFGTRA